MIQVDHYVGGFWFKMEKFARLSDILKTNPPSQIIPDPESTTFCKDKYSDALIKDFADVIGAGQTWQWPGPFQSGHPFEMVAAMAFLTKKKSLSTTEDGKYLGAVGTHDFI